MGFGDASASHSWEMSPVIGELQDKLNSATAKVGDRVVLKTTEKVMTADGTVIPRGTRLLGHITQVQTRDATHGVRATGHCVRSCGTQEWAKHRDFHADPRREPQLGGAGDESHESRRPHQHGRDGRVDSGRHHDRRRQGRSTAVGSQALWATAYRERLHQPRPRLEIERATIPIRIRRAR